MQISTKNKPCGFEACGKVIVISTRQGAKDFVTRHRKAMARAKEPGGEALAKALPEVTFDRVPVSDVLDFLRDITGVKIDVDWQKLEAAGVERNAPVNLRAKDISFAQALQLVLDNAGAAKQEIGFEVKDGRVVIGPVKGEKPPPSQKPESPDGL